MSADECRLGRFDDRHTVGLELVIKSSHETWVQKINFSRIFAELTGSRGLHGREGRFRFQVEISQVSFNRRWMQMS
jgi:hypothetical protein